MMRSQSTPPAAATAAQHRLLRDWPSTAAAAAAAAPLAVPVLVRKERLHKAHLEKQQLEQEVTQLQAEVQALVACLRLERDACRHELQVRKARHEQGMQQVSFERQSAVDSMSFQLRRQQILYERLSVDHKAAVQAACKQQAQLQRRGAKIRCQRQQLQRLREWVLKAQKVLRGIRPLVDVCLAEVDDQECQAQLQALLEHLAQPVELPGLGGAEGGAEAEEEEEEEGEVPVLEDDQVDIPARSSRRQGCEVARSELNPASYASNEGAAQGSSLPAMPAMKGLHAVGSTAGGAVLSSSQIELIDMQLPSMPRIRTHVQPVAQPVAKLVVEPVSDGGDGSGSNGSGSNQQASDKTVHSGTGATARIVKVLDLQSGTCRMFTCVPQGTRAGPATGAAARAAALATTGAAARATAPPQLLLSHGGHSSGAAPHRAHSAEATVAAATAPVLPHSVSTGKPPGLLSQWFRPSCCGSSSSSSEQQRRLSAAGPKKPYRWTGTAGASGDALATLTSVLDARVSATETDCSGCSRGGDRSQPLGGSTGEVICKVLSGQVGQAPALPPAARASEV